MKRIVSLLFVLSLIFALTGCKNNNDKNINLAKSIANSYVSQLDDFIDAYAESDVERQKMADVLLEDLLEQAQDTGVASDYRELLTSMESALLAVQNGDADTVKIERDFLANYFGSKATTTSPNNENTDVDSKGEDKYALGRAAYYLLNDYLKLTPENGRYTVVEQMHTLFSDAEKSLKEDDDLYRILEFTMSAMENNSEDVPSFVRGYLSVFYVDKLIDPDSFFFINENCYVYSNTDDDPTYSDFYLVIDFSKYLFGVYNNATKEFVIEPSLMDIQGASKEGLICVCYQGYYGFINCYGEKVIGYIYEEPMSFNDGLAVACANGLYGVIDTAGNSVLPTKYKDVRIKTSCDIIVADLPKGYVTSYAVFDYEGNQLTEHAYADFVYDENRLFALWNEDAMDAVDTDEDIWYDLLDYSGKRLIGDGTSVPEVWGVKLPDSYGIMIAECHGTLVNSYSVEYPKYSPYTMDYCYTYITSDLQRLTNNYYRHTYAGDMLTEFNQHGYAIATLATSRRGTDSVDVLLYVDGRELEVLPVVDGDTTVIDVNDYVFKMKDGYTYSGQPMIYGLYIRATGEFIPYKSVTLIDGKNMAIVQDAETNLYGLYDGDTLALDIVYNEIEVVDGQIVAKRGAEEIKYTGTK